MTAGSPWNPFVDPTELPIMQLAFLTTVYSFVLFYASNLISDGSELLVFIPRLQGIVGSVVLPVLGAIPDSMMVFFSLQGSQEEVAREVGVGVGTLAGSTIMLLTLPWVVSIIFGRVDLDSSGIPVYKKPKNYSGSRWQKLTVSGLQATLFETGVQGNRPALRMNAILMMVTLTSYLIIQIPALIFDKSENGYGEQGAQENTYAGVAFFICLAWFLIYLIHQYREGQSESKEEIEHEVDLMEDLIKSGKFTIIDAMDQFSEECNTEKSGTGVHEMLLDLSSVPKKSLARMKILLKHFLHKYDTNKDNEINMAEFFLLCQDMGMHDGNVQSTLFKAADIDDNGSISCSEFTSCMIDYALKRTHSSQPALPNRKSISDVHDLIVLNADVQDEEAGAVSDEEKCESESDDDGDSPPEDLEHLDPKARQFWILIRSFRTMLFGTLLVVVFSDPMVAVLATIGERMNISPFYVSFVVAPIASNASELVAAYNYAVKKTRRSITVSLSTLQGAACMNNTFCLSVFLGMIWSRSFPWQFTAETISIIVAEVALAAYSFFRPVGKTIDAIPIFMVYPLSLALTVTLEYFGMD